MAISAIAGGNRAESIVKEIHDPSSKTVLVACHRGDWRNYPENSLAAIESVIKMGADIVEIDLALTKDSMLVVCHDRTIDRTTTGKGLIADITYDSITHVNLKSGHGVGTRHKMPTLREALQLCKDRIVINIDKGYDYYDLILPISDSLGMTEQLLIKGKKPVKAVAKKMASHKHNMMYMPIIDILKPKGEKLLQGVHDHQHRTSCLRSMLGQNDSRRHRMHGRNRGPALQVMGQLSMVKPLRRT